MADQSAFEKSTRERDLVGKNLGRYRILKTLASGGMATVYLASVEGHEGFSKQVALKVIHDHLADDSGFVEMFLDEARIAARIDHANVCTVFDFGECDGTYFIAMEFLTGETLGSIRDVVRRSPYRPDWPYLAASMIVQACAGLHAAHNLLAADGAPLELVHRDVSPQNLFVTFSGTTKVVDFGIARASGRQQHTAPGTIKGKFAYLAPEQVSRPDAVDRRVDVWAIGVTLWELLAMKPLFRRSTPAATLAAVLSEPIVPPSSIQSAVPPALDAIVLRALDRDPDARYATARDLGRDLTAACRAAGALSGPSEIEERLEELLPHPRESHARAATATPVESHARVRSELAPTPLASRPSVPSPIQTAEAITLRRGAAEPRMPSPRSDRPGPGHPQVDRVRGLVATGTLILVGIAVGILAATMSPREAAPPAEYAHVHGP